MDINNPNGNKDNGNQPKMPKFNMNWIYGIIIATLAILFVTGGGDSLASGATAQQKATYTKFKYYVEKGYAKNVVVNKDEGELKMYVHPKFIRTVFNKPASQTGADPYVDVVYGSGDELDKYLSDAQKRGKIVDYSYEKKDGKWVGVTKEESTRVVFPEFDLVPNNDSRVRVESWRIFFGCSDFDSKYYSWDTANDAWVLDRSNVSEFAVNGNMLEYKSKSHSQKYDVEVTGYVKRDDAHRMTEICRVDKTIYPNGNTEVNRTLLYKYTYNSDGKLAQQEIYQDDTYLGRTVYTYSDIVVTEVEQVVDGTTYKLRISGRDITANGKSAITLYDMSGRVVAQGSNGKVVAPANGMYVVSVDGKNIKISVNAK